MRILIVVRSLNWQGGGVDVAAQLASSLELAGHEVVLLSLSDQVLERRLHADPKPSSLVFLSCRGFLDGIRRLRQFLRTAGRFDIGHAIGDSAFSRLVLASTINSKRPLSLVASLHSRECAVFGRLTGAKGRVFNRVAQFCYGRADGVIADASALAAEFHCMTSMQHIPVRTIRNPVAVTLREPSEVREARNDTPIRVIGIGALHHRKDFFTLLNSIAILRKSIECDCVILGDGPLLPELKRERRRLGLDDVVTFVGYQSDVDSYLDASDVFVLSSLSEGNPLVLVRALARGLAVVATDCPHGPRETLDDGRLGELVPIRAPQHMANAIARVAANPPSVPELLERANLFSPTLVANSYIDFFYETLVLKATPDTPRNSVSPT